MQDNLLEILSNITKAAAYDVLVTQVKELKEIIRQLIEVGELDDLTFTEEKQTEEFKTLVNKAKILLL